MPLSEEIISRFRATVREKYGRELTVAEATQILDGLVDYYDLLAKILHREERGGDEEAT